MVGAAIGEKIAAQQRPSRVLHDQARFPAMRQMWRIEPLQTESSSLEDFGVAEDTSLTIGDIVHRSHREKATAQRDCVRSRGEELIEGTALVGLEVRERDPAQAFQRQDAGHSLLY
jgi:hypothetical protein